MRQGSQADNDYHIKTDFSQMAKRVSWCATTFTKCYCIYENEHGLYLGAPSDLGGGLHSISEPLKRRLWDLAAAECLAIEFHCPCDYQRAEEMVVSLRWDEKVAKCQNWLLANCFYRIML